MDRYTKFILTVIAIALVGDLFQDYIFPPANAWSTNNIYMLLEDEVIPLLNRLIAMH